MRAADRGTLLICAVRYAIGRRTYMAGEVARIVRAGLREIAPRDVEVLHRDIREALEQGRAGDECDEREWRALLDWLSEPGDADCASDGNDSGIGT